MDNLKESELTRVEQTILFHIGQHKSYLVVSGNKHTDAYEWLKRYKWSTEQTREVFSAIRYLDDNKMDFDVKNIEMALVGLGKYLTLTDGISLRLLLTDKTYGKMSFNDCINYLKGKDYD